jgi:hypothetical protein
MLCRIHSSLVSSSVIYPSVIGCWLATLACSGATDVVGILDDTSASSAESIASAAPSPDEALAVVQGRRLPDWRGAVLEWPLPMPLRELFAGGAAADGSAGDAVSGDGSSFFGAAGRASWQGVSTRRSRDGSRRFPGAAFESQPPLGVLGGGAAGNARARIDPSAPRSVVLRGDPAERLLSLFAGAVAGPGVPPTAVVRDEAGDVYGIMLDIEADLDAERDTDGDGSLRGGGAPPDGDGCEAWNGRGCMGGNSSR